MEWDVVTLMEGHLLGASSILLRNSSQAIVVDTGLANQRNSLITGLKNQGLTTDDVNLVLNTHLHVDHSNNNCIFKNARILATRENYQWTLALQRRLDVMNEQNLSEIDDFYPEILSAGLTQRFAAKFIQIERRLWLDENIGRPDQYDWIDESAKLPPGIRAIPTPGHVPSHVSFIVDGADHQVLIAGDALIIRGGDEKQVMTFPPQRRAAFETSKDWVSSFPGEIIPGHDVRFLNLPVDSNQHSMGLQ
jgi:glyoxylase-like metal-dependent hydrolase (beta-lactamase superfamily II)